LIITFSSFVGVLKTYLWKMQGMESFKMKILRL